MLDFFTGTEVTTKNLNNFIKSINKYKYCHMKSNNSCLPHLYRVNKVSNNHYTLTNYDFKNNKMVVHRTTKPMNKSDLMLYFTCRRIFNYQ